MLPKIAAGDFVIASRWFFALRVGDTVIIDHPIYDQIVKRVEKICPVRGYWLTGENENSIPSEKIGWVSRGQVVAKAIKIIRRQKHPSYSV